MYQDWESVYRDNVDRIYRLVFARVGNRPDAEDLTADVFKAALPPLRLSASQPEVRAYLAITAQAVLASHWRRRFGIEVTSLDPATEFTSYEESGDDDKARRKLQRSWKASLSVIVRSSSSAFWSPCRCEKLQRR